MNPAPGHSAPVFVLVPTFNEASNIERMVAALLAIPLAHAILVVDDFSPDDTGRIVKEVFGGNGRVILVERAGLAGRGQASVYGYREFLKSDAEWLCEIDADFQEDPADIARLYAAAMETNADLVVGSRYVDGGSSSSEKTWLSKTANLCMRLLFRSKIRDVTCSFHLIHRRVLEKMPMGRLNSRTFFVFVQLHLLAERMGFRCSEIACHFPAREAGDSKVSLRHVLKFGVEALRFRFSLIIE